MRASDILDLPEEEAVERIRGLAVRPSDALPTLLSLALANSPAISRAALETLDVVVAAVPELRRNVRHGPLSGWWSGDHHQAIRALKRHPDAFGLAVACSFVGNGYVREAAVRALAGHARGRALPYLILRSEDWVRAVAKTAADAAIRHIRSASDDALAAAFPAFSRINRLSFRLGSRVARAYQDELHGRPGLMSLVRSLAPSRDVAWLLDQRKVGPGERWEDLLRTALGRRDPIVATAAIRQILLLSDEGQVALLDALMASPIPRARAFAMDVAHRHGRADLLQAGIHDANWRVRNDARFYLEKQGVTDFAEQYAERFPKASAVAGFGEVAADNELSVLLPFMDHASSAVRREAIRALGRREYRPATEAIEGRLADSSSSVVRAAVAALQALRVSVSVDTLRALLEDTGRPAQVRRAVYGALELVPRWDRLPAILEGCSSEELRRRSTPLLESWLGARPQPRWGPATQQLQNAQAALASAEGVLDPSLVARLRSELHYWSEQTNP